MKATHFILVTELGAEELQPIERLDTFIHANTVLMVRILAIFKVRQK